MNFKELLYRARRGDEDAILEIFEMYRPLLIKSILLCMKQINSMIGHLWFTLLEGNLLWHLI